MKVTDFTPILRQYCAVGKDILVIAKVLNANPQTVHLGTTLLMINQDLIDANEDLLRVLRVPLAPASEETRA